MAAPCAQPMLRGGARILEGADGTPLQPRQPWRAAPAHTKPSGHDVARGVEGVTLARRRAAAADALGELVIERLSRRAVGVRKENRGAAEDAASAAPDGELRD